MLNKLYEWIDKVWQAISNLIFVRFSFDIPIDLIREPNQQGRLVFALTDGGIIEWLILSSWSRKQGLGAILISNRKRILLFAKPLYFLQVVFWKRTYSDLFLSSQEGPRLVFCPPGERKQLFTPTETEELIAQLYLREQQDSQHVSFCFVPLFICWRKHVRGAARQLTEYFFGLSSKPNFFGKIWYLARKRTDSTVRSLAPISWRTKDLSEPSDELDGVDASRMARMMRRKILVEVNQEMRVVLGPRYFSPYSVKESLMKDPEILKAVDQISKEKNLDRKKVMGLAYQYLTEIAANYKFRFVEVMYVVLTWLFGKLFEDIVVDPNQIQQLRETMKTKAVVFVSCHRSHLDYLVVPRVLFVEDIVTPHIAAGVNLSFWPVGPFLRMGGAFFIRRSFRGEPLYAVCLQEYVEWLLKNRINIKFFIEGTRSRTGKMLPPAYGLLKMVAQTYEDKQVDDIALVPISISYDEVLEEGTYGKELAGAQKEKESAKGLIQSRKLFKRNIGKIYVRFAPSISIKEEYQEGTNQGLDPTLLLQKMAFNICKCINDSTPITPKAILSSIFLSHEKPFLSLEDILRSADTLAQYASWAESELSAGDSELEFKRAIETFIKRLQADSSLLVQPGIPVTYSLDPRKRINLTFYKNNSIHCFIIPSITLLSVCRAFAHKKTAISEFEAEVIKQALTLRNLFKFEFFFSPTQQFVKEIRDNLIFLCDGKDGDLIDKDRFQAGMQKRFFELQDSSLFIRLTRDIVESYLIVLDVLKSEGAGSHESKSLLQKAVREGVLRVESNGSFKPECISTQNFTNAFKLMENFGLISQTREKDKNLLQIRNWNTEAQTTLDELIEFHRLLRMRVADILV
ncbi:MAG: hypothetical protein EB120_04925 [Proteobacteria bacterium]|nr:hypothetical protein [Pseudomonadota bacterium]NDG26501.1 hypothetical protein [Pseudomonadota bacterium]